MTKQEIKAQNLANSGKGLTRVEIAQRAVDRLTAELDAAKARLEKAIRDAESGATKKADKQEKQLRQAIKNLRLAGQNAEADRLEKKLAK